MLRYSVRYSRSSWSLCAGNPHQPLRTSLTMRTPRYGTASALSSPPDPTDFEITLSGIIDVPAQTLTGGLDPFCTETGTGCTLGSDYSYSSESTTLTYSGNPLQGCDASEGCHFGYVSGPCIAGLDWLNAAWSYPSSPLVYVVPPVSISWNLYTGKEAKEVRFAIVYLQTTVPSVSTLSSWYYVPYIKTKGKAQPKLDFTNYGSTGVDVYKLRNRAQLALAKGRLP